MKRRIVVFIGQQKSFNSNEEQDEEQVASSHHITICECDDSNSEIELTETPKTLEYEGQATVDHLKEVNLRTRKEPRPIYASSLLSPKEEKEYFDVLSEHKDVFVWNYKEMLILDPKVAVHC